MEFDAFDAWLAGFIDGEGCICITKAGLQPYVYVAIFQHERSRHVLEEIRHRYGGSISQGTGTSSLGNKRSVLRLSVCSQTQVHDLLSATLPHLRVKREKALAALDIVGMQLANGKDARRWTEREDAVVLRDYATKTAREIGKALGRGESGVWYRARRLGLSSPTR